MYKPKTYNLDLMHKDEIITTTKGKLEDMIKQHCLRCQKVSRADIEKELALNARRIEGIITKLLSLTLYDKEGFGKKRILRILENIKKLVEFLDCGEVKIHDIDAELKRIGVDIIETEGNE